MTEPNVMLEVKDLCKYFDLGGGRVLKAVDNVSFNIKRGEILGLVGESGCGKTTLGRTVKQLYQPTSGSILFDGEEIIGQSKERRKQFSRRTQMIFQDPYSSLDPRMTVAEIISEGMEIHNIGTARQREERVIELLEMVGLNREHANRFPHEFSGGQRQRVGIARALAVDPEFVICDEPISALDVSIQAQVLNLMQKLQKDMGLTYLFISHNLSVVKHISDRIAVMYLGRMVELSDCKALFANPMHPYTKALLSAVPIPRLDVRKERILLEGDVPSPVNPAPGCRFAGRCASCMEICRKEQPELREVEPGHFAACHLIEQ